MSAKLLERVLPNDKGEIPETSSECIQASVTGRFFDSDPGKYSVKHKNKGL
jgi:hypothetical protein